MASKTPKNHTGQSGLLPINKDGFESGDRENFAPVYIGDSEEWIRPQFTVSDKDPIAGNYSLVLSGDGTQQKWLLVSNAFHLANPLRISLLFRQLKPGAQFALLGAVERYSKGEIPRFALVDALRVSGADVSLDLEADAADWPTSNSPARDIVQPDTVYRLIMEYAGSGEVRARILDEQSQQILARFAGVSQTLQNGIGLYFHAPSGQQGAVQIDDIEIEYDQYELQEGTWDRSPQFVIFKRPPDAVEDQGEWVGGASVLYDEEEKLYKLWYRIRRGGIRGVGYGYATSKDGLSWERYAENPVLMYDKEVYSSTEKITVIKIDGEYKGWFTGDTGKTWHIVYATSPDGIAWTQHGEVLNDGYFKDPDVVYVDGTYFMYLISPTSEDLSVMTSKDGIDWKFEAQIPAPCHVHIGAYYDAQNALFVLFQDAVDQVPYMRAATSEDGIHFGEFEPILYNAEVGLDDIGIGVNYPTFYRDGLGHITGDDHVVMLYQARHDYHNNRPGWPYAGDGKLVMAGLFRGVKLNVPSTYEPGEGLFYRTFPIHCPTIEGLALKADAPVEFIVEIWNPEGDVVGELSTSAKKTQVTWTFTQLKTDADYLLTSGADDPVEFSIDENGTAAGSMPIDGIQNWKLVRK